MTVTLLTRSSSKTRFWMVICAVLLSGCAKQEFQKVCLKGACVEAERVSTASQRSRGLMFRSHLSDGKGMFFVFEREDAYAFWMKNTRIPLDIIWVSTDRKVVEIAPSAQPCKEECKSFTPRAKAQYVLEVNAGFTQKHGIQIGDPVIF